MGGRSSFTVANELATVWRRDKTVYLTQAGNSQEQSLGSGEQPAIASGKGGLYVVWLKKRGEAAYLLAPGTKSPRELAPAAGDPVLAAGPEGGPVVAAWEVREGATTTLRIQVISK